MPDVGQSTVPPLQGGAWPVEFMLARSWSTCPDLWGGGAGTMLVDDVTMVN